MALLETDVKALRSKALSRLQETLLSMASFVEIQKPWLMHAAKAHREGYFVESSYLSLHQIHLVLRKGLWLAAQEEAVAMEGSAGDRFLYRLLLHPERLLPAVVPDTELFGAALEHGLLDAATRDRLLRLHGETPVVVRNLFLATEEPHAILERHSGELLRINKLCLRLLQRKLKEAEGAVKKM
ncbi:MAG: hypothetical protein PHW10_00080 [Candidatus Peribacteraceae bacterium]|nr:hypothetical protein [Candidatus Peribacteraceae bacterium]